MSGLEVALVDHSPMRTADKDAVDVVRIMQTIDPSAVGGRSRDSRRAATRSS